MSAPERGLLAAIRGALMENAGVQALLGATPRLYDDRPPEGVFPYVTFGGLETRPAEAEGGDALEHVLTLHAWSRHGGRAETLEIIGALRAALHDQPLAVAGRRLVLLFATFADVFRAGDGRTTHGVLRLRAITEPE